MKLYSTFFMVAGSRIPSTSGFPDPQNTSPEKNVRFIHVLRRALLCCRTSCTISHCSCVMSGWCVFFYQTLFAFRPVDPRFVFVGDGRPPQSNRMAQIHDVFEDITDRCTRPCAYGCSASAPLCAFFQSSESSNLQVSEYSVPSESARSGSALSPAAQRVKICRTTSAASGSGSR